MRGKLTFLGILMLLIWVALLLPSIYGIIRGYQAQNFYDAYLPGGNQLAAIILGLAFIFVFTTYGLAIKQSSIASSTEVLTWICIFTIVLVFMFPFACQDVYYYIATGRIQSTYQANPYITTAHQIAGWRDDPFLSSSIWGFLPNVYGPIWTKVTHWLVLGAANNLWLAVFMFKLLAGLLHLLNTVLIGFTARQYRVNSAQAMLVYGWNPLLLFELPGHAHNDALLLTMLILTFYTLSLYQGLLALPCLTLATMVKYTPLLLFPFIVVWLWMNKCFKGIIFGLILSVFTLTIVWAPYWSGIQTLQGLLRQMNFYSIKSLHYLLFTNLHRLLPHIPTNTIFARVDQGLTAVFLLATLFLVVKLYYQRNFLDRRITVRYSIILLVLYLLIVNKWYQVWYLSWLIPLAALIKIPSPLAITVLLLSFSAEMSRIPQLFLKNMSMQVQLSTFIIAWFPIIFYFIGGHLANTYNKIFFSNGYRRN